MSHKKTRHPPLSWHSGVGHRCICVKVKVPMAPRDARDPPARGGRRRRGRPRAAGGIESSESNPSTRDIILKPRSLLSESEPYVLPFI